MEQLHYFTNAIIVIITTFNVHSIPSHLCSSTPGSNLNVHKSFTDCWFFNHWIAFTDFVTLTVFVDFLCSSAFCLKFFWLIFSFDLVRQINLVICHFSGTTIKNIHLYLNFVFFGFKIVVFFRFYMRQLC